MFTSIHVIQSEGYGPYITVPKVCLQPLATLFANAVIIPNPICKSLRAENEPNEQLKLSPELLFTKLHKTQLCTQSCPLGPGHCQLLQENSENTITSGPRFTNARYTIHPAYEAQERDGNLISSRGLTISERCPLTPSEISNHLVMVIPADVDRSYNPEGDLSFAQPDAQGDPMISIGAMLSNAYFRIDEQPNKCVTCNEFCSLNPRLRTINFAK